MFLKKCLRGALHYFIIDDIVYLYDWIGACILIANFSKTLTTIKQSWLLLHCNWLTFNVCVGLRSKIDRKLIGINAIRSAHRCTWLTMIIIVHFERKPLCIVIYYSIVFRSVKRMRNNCIQKAILTFDELLKKTKSWNLC